ncbi:aldehyde dehydrogenase family protein [Microbacterium sp. NC79]|uniref:aldehyde dehydrogenase family protein n=1 Tax=Microbacterium sp. NC79 TaxID=2851009 RepID=UPI001C2C6F77|nr:aldehyde dehydrogenase family protein [Microbacterium sp. NC79]MBV0893798.1 aldehyde dehydrogenase family protein [Microbacterium sp. NC79]
MSPTAAPQPKKPAAKKAETKKSVTKKSAASAPTIAADIRASLDADIAALEMGGKIWSTLTVGQRSTVLGHVRDAVAKHAEEWALTAAASKGLDAQHPLRGEEWLAGPYATLAGLDALKSSLDALVAGNSPIADARTSLTPTGQVAVHAFPATKIDAMLLNGFTGEVWLKPGVTVDQAKRTAGLAQLTPTEGGGVGLVLGAGNVTSIPILDVMYELIAFNRVALLKLNPTQDSLLGVFRKALQPLIEPGFVRIVTGAGDVGAYLTAHEGFSHVHITGSAVTFDTIVWGPGEAGQKRKATGQPQLTTPITGELGGVAPIIVVPGPWTQADLDYQAEHVVTMRLQNSGHICISGQVVIVSPDWEQKDDFLAAVRRAYAKAPQRPVWYPNSDAKRAIATNAYPDAEQYGPRLLVEIDGDDDATTLETTEFFSPVLGIVEVDGTGQQFVENAVAYANERLAGTLGANVLIDPITQANLGEGFERAITELHYGNIAINGWTGFSFVAPTLSWGAFPGHTLEDVGSGIGIVHNALLLDDVERSVLRGPFRPFPRSLGRSRFSILPKPPWFVTSRTSAEVSEGFTRFLIDNNVLRLTKTLGAALRS